MGKISDYTRVLAAKLADVFVVDQTDNGTTETKSATVEQIGTAIGTLQNFADLDTSNKSLVDAINEIASYTPVYGNTASGAIATFDTSLALPLQDCTIEINGTNLTGANIKVVGANLWDEEWLHGYYNTSGEYVSNANYLCSKNMFRVKPNTTYYYLVPTGYTGRIVYYDINGDFISRTGTGTANNTFTTPTNCYFIHLLVDNYSSDYNNDVSVNYPATDTAYHAYDGTTYPITWQDEAGTVSEGSLNVTTGHLTVVNGSMGAGDYQITPIPINQLSGTNNIFCDTGNTSVVYACSLKDYIDSQ